MHIVDRSLLGLFDIPVVGVARRGTFRGQCRHMSAKPAFVIGSRPGSHRHRRWTSVPFRLIRGLSELALRVTAAPDTSLSTTARNSLATKARSKSSPSRRSMGAAGWLDAAVKLREAHVAAFSSSTSDTSCCASAAKLPSVSRNTPCLSVRPYGGWAADSASRYTGTTRCDCGLARAI